MSKVCVCVTEKLEFLPKFTHAGRSSRKGNSIFMSIICHHVLMTIYVHYIS